MGRTLHLGRSLLLAALALGLNALCYFGYTHGHRAVHHSRVNYSHVPPHGTHRPTSRGSGRSQRFSASDQSSVDHSGVKVASKNKPMHPGVLVAAMPTATVALVPQRTTGEILAAVNIISLGSAPRAPSGSRAPPTV